MKKTYALLMVLYFASGAAGLVDEVVFFKYLSFVFGATAHASSAVLVAFMGGLAVGALGASAFEKRVTRPLVAYGVLEIAVGVACASTPWLFSLVHRAYVALAAGSQSLVALSLLRGALATAVVIVPAVGMGATLPLVTRAVGATEIGARRLATLYALNTAGGAFGSLAGAYAVVPALGLSGAVRASALVSALVGVAAIAFGRDVTAAPDAAAKSDDAPSPVLARSLAVAAIASGVFVFASEVVFVHVLALIVGTSVYAFGLIVAVFLVALSIGAAASKPLARRAGSSALALSLAFTALALAATIPLWDKLPQLFERFGPSVSSWSGRESIRALVAFAALALPATCMGMTFPLVLQAIGPHARSARAVGRLTAANTFASIAGSIVGGWVMIPGLGSQRSLVAVAIGYAIVALVVVAEKRARAVAMATSAAAVAVGVLAPKWDLTRLAGGANVYFERQLWDDARVVWVHEDVHGGVTTVTRAGSTTTLWTNGKFQGDDGFQMTAQHAFAHIPMLFVPRSDRALVIGLGTGTTLGALAAYPFARIDIAELSPGIVDAARTYFRSINFGALEDPRVHVRLEDGRNVLLLGSETYDLIGIEISSIWFAGAANLYNREFYETALARLAPEGVLQQWLQLHHTSRRALATQMQTAREVFPHVAFFIRGEQGILLASRMPLVSKRAHTDALDARPELRAILGERTHLADYLNDIVLEDESLDAFIDEVARENGVAKGALVSTDDNEWLEYATPRTNVPGLPDTDETGAMLKRYRREGAAARHSAP